MIKAIYPGSFDPVTEGHINVIRRASRMFDRLYVTVMVNTQKNSLFSGAERVDMIHSTVADLENVEVLYKEGLLADFARELGAGVLVKGLRTSADYENEFQMSLINRKLNPSLDTIFIPAEERFLFLSSSAVKAVALSGGDITGFVPEPLKQKILQRIQNLEG